jgi:L-amino acid N-acyltransferase YncA
MTPSVRAMADADAPTVLAIYQEGIAGGNATFEEKAPDWATWLAAHHTHSRFVADTDTDNGIAGWAALAPVSQRAVYRGVAEVSIYVSDAATGAGVGGALMAALIESAERHGVWTLQSSIFEENRASARLHARHGFRTVGRRDRIGLMTFGPQKGRWRDTILLERRSATIGSS